jgi:UDP-arabinose 4-epimerase
LSILIVGGAGYIGSHTAKLVAASGRRPVIFDNLSSGHRWALQWGDFEEGDLADRAAIDRVLAKYDVEAVIDFAAHIEVGESVRNPRKYFRNNLVNTLNLLDAMVDKGIKDIVFSSTAAVYGDPLVVPIPEDHRLLPVNPYGESKLFVERTLRWYGEAYGLRWAVLRYFNAAGADPGGEIGEDHGPESHLIPLAIKAALGQRGELQIFGTDYPTPDGTAVRDYIHVVDLAQAHLLALAHLAAGNDHSASPSFVANIGTGQGHSVREVLNTVERVSGRTVPRREVGRRPGDAPSLVADARRATALLGFQPRHPDLLTIVEHAWKWHASRTG